jgi:hypothetical protein
LAASFVCVGIFALAGPLIGQPSSALRSKGDLTLIGSERLQMTDPERTSLAPNDDRFTE